MPPYVVKQGDYLLQLAYSLGFDADTVWSDASNAELNALRSDHNILFPGDVLNLPGPTGGAPPPSNDLTPGTTNSFVTDVPTANLSVKFVGSDPSAYASKAYTVAELTDLTGLTTDASGVIALQVPVTLGTATITFTDSGEVFRLVIGGMDPCNTLSGIFKRLKNLGYIRPDATFDPSDLDSLRTALQLLRAAQPGNAAATSTPPSAGDGAQVPASSPAPTSAPASGASPAASSPGGAPDSAPASSPPSAPDSAPGEHAGHG